MTLLNKNKSEETEKGYSHNLSSVHSLLEKVL